MDGFKIISDNTKRMNLSALSGSINKHDEVSAKHAN
jgi:hypothetical protein